MSLIVRSGELPLASFYPPFLYIHLPYSVTVRLVRMPLRAWALDRLSVSPHAAHNLVDTPIPRMPSAGRTSSPVQVFLVFVDADYDLLRSYAHFSFSVATTA